GKIPGELVLTEFQEFATHGILRRSEVLTQNLLPHCASLVVIAVVDAGRTRFRTRQSLVDGYERMSSRDILNKHDVAVGQAEVTVQCCRRLDDFRFDHAVLGSGEHVEAIGYNVSDVADLVL